MTIYAQDRGLNMNSAIIRTDGNPIYIDRPCQAFQKCYKVECTVLCGAHLIAAVPTAEDAERLVKAIAEAERDGVPFLTVSGGEVVEDQSEGARHGL